MVIDNVLDVRHADDGHLHPVSLLLGSLAQLGVDLAERADAGPELGPQGLPVGHLPDVRLARPETLAVESEVWR